MINQTLEGQLGDHVFRNRKNYQPDSLDLAEIDRLDKILQDPDKRRHNVYVNTCNDQYPFSVVIKFDEDMFKHSGYFFMGCFESIDVAQVVANISARAFFGKDAVQGYVDYEEVVLDLDLANWKLDAANQMLIHMAKGDLPTATMCVSNPDIFLEELNQYAKKNIKGTLLVNFKDKVKTGKWYRKAR